MAPKRRRLNAKPNDIMILPLELWKKIFENLNFRDVLTCSKVCCQWSNVSLRYFINPQLKVFASLRPELDAFLQEKGWNEEWLDMDFIDEVFKKFKPYRTRLVIAGGENENGENGELPTEVISLDEEDKEKILSYELKPVPSKIVSLNHQRDLDSVWNFGAFIDNKKVFCTRDEPTIEILDEGNSTIYGRLNDK